MKDINLVENLCFKKYFLGLQFFVWEWRFENFSHKNPVKVPEFASTQLTKLTFLGVVYINFESSTGSSIFKYFSFNLNIGYGINI